MRTPNTAATGSCTTSSGSRRRPTWSRPCGTPPTPRGSDAVVHAVFVFFAVVAILSAILCITQRQPVGAIMWLIVTMLALSGIFTLLGGPFAGVMQVLVYAGAILGLFMFCVILLQLRHKESDIRGPLGWVLAVGVATALVMQLSGLGGYTAGR